MAKRPDLHCPFCHAAVSARDTACRQCRAEKRTHGGMSPTGFRWYFGLWAALSLPLMLIALWFAAVPWLPTGEPPGYALAMVGAKPTEPVERCVVQVVDAAGRIQQLVTDGACGAGKSASAPAPAQGGGKTTLRMAAALHSVLTLLAGLLASALLLRAIRKPFLRRTQASWVRRAAA